MTSLRRFLVGFGRNHHVSLGCSLLVILGICGACSPDAIVEQGRGGLIAQDEIPDDLCEYQAAILADGIVTPLEYDKAIFATVECMTERGLLEAEAEKQDFTGMYQIGMRESPEGILADEQIFMECEEEYKSHVEFEYSKIVGSDAQFALLADLMRECLLKEGRKESIEIPDDDLDGSFEDLELVAEGTICQVR